MTLTPGGRYVAACLVLAALLALVGVIGRVASGHWDAEKVAAVVIAVPTLLALVRRWEA